MLGSQIRMLSCFMLLALSLWPATREASGNDKPRPFKGYAVGAIEEVVPISATEVSLVVEYSGNATHLGRFTRTEWVVVDLASGTVLGSMVFVAANGDTLTLDFDGVFTSPSTVEGCYTFTGGTGRFSDATGTTCYVATVLGPIGVGAPVEVVFDGFIRY